LKDHTSGKKFLKAFLKANIEGSHTENNASQRILIVFAAFCLNRADVWQTSPLIKDALENSLQDRQDN